MPKKTDTEASNSGNDTRIVPDHEHPDYTDGRIDGYGTNSFTPVPDGPLPQPFPFPRPLPGPFPEPFPFPTPFPEPGPWPGGRPIPTPWPPLNVCGPVSGRYRHTARPVIGPPIARPFPGPVPSPIPILPFNSTTITVRVDVDRFWPQNRISIEVRRLFPSRTAHAIAEVTSDACLGYFNRRVEANIIYRDGQASLIPGDRIVFEARRVAGRGYSAYSITLSGAGTTPRTFDLVFESRYFDSVEFEVDQVDNAAAPTTSIDSAAHPTRPADLPAETLNLTNVFQRAGFDVSISSNGGVIPATGSGSNGTWSDGEMHNAMITHWSRFTNNPNWAMWVLFARQHDQGRSLGGVMFDDIGPNHRQGTAIFTDSFVQDVPAGDANPAAWRQRMVFWTAVHEMGHAFNLAHSWQKALGTADGAPGDPWIPLANEPEARSFMNYPFRVSGGQAAFFADFRFRFSDMELQFMRHAPRRFVQMGNSNWFANHNFEEPGPTTQSGNWTLAIRPNRDVNQYAFLEPVKLELKLTNSAGVPQPVEADLLQDGRHITLLVARNEGPTRQWQPFITKCHESHFDNLAPGKSIYGEHMISATTSGWLIDEPGFYQIQAAVDMGNEIVVSNVLRIHVMPAASMAEIKLAPDYFTEDVGRVLAFAGAPELSAATDTLRDLVAKAPANPAATHAEVALSTPLLRDYKHLVDGTEGKPKLVSTAPKIDAARTAQMAALVDKPDAAASTMGHIDYFDALDTLATALDDAGDSKGAVQVLKSSIATMKKRGVLESVIARAERKLDKAS